MAETDSYKRKWVYHITQLRRLKSGRITLIFQGSVTQIFCWIHSKKTKGQVKRDGRLWIEAADERAIIPKKPGRKGLGNNVN